MSLSEAELQDLKNQVKYRDKEFELLNSYIHRDVELSSQCIIVHGFKSTGKTLLVTKFLQALGVKHTIMNCDESISKKLLLRRCFDKIKEDSVQAPTEFNSVYEFSKQGSSADNFSSFISSLQKFNASYNYNEHHVLVLDRLDQCFEYSADLLASFSRLRESSKLKNLSIIAILSGDVPKEVITLSNPHVYLKVYDESQVIEILQSKRICKFGFETNDDHGDFYNQYVKVIVGSFYQYTGSDLSLLINVVERLWEPFTRPVKEGRLQATEFVKVYKENIDLLTSEDVVSNSGVIDFKTFQREQELNQDGHIQDLPLHSKFLLLASYLASYNSQRNDIHKYSKVKAVKYKKRLTKSQKVSKLGGESGNKQDIDTRLLTANHVDLERISAILAVLYRNSGPTLNKSDRDDLLYIDDEVIDNEEKKEAEKSKFTLTRNIDLNSQIATLFSLGLLSKTSSSDILAARVRWKCNIDWNAAKDIADSVNFPLAEFLLEE